jgi:hypothetical protein
MVAAVWKQLSPDDAPSLRDIDKFLMMSHIPHPYSWVYEGFRGASGSQT